MKKIYRTKEYKQGYKTGLEGATDIDKAFSFCIGGEKQSSDYTLAYWEGAKDGTIARAFQSENK